MKREHTCYLSYNACPPHTERDLRAREYFNTLTPEDRKTIIEVNGRKYIKKMYEYRNKKEVTA